MGERMSTSVPLVPSLQTHTRMNTHAHKPSHTLSHLFVILGLSLIPHFLWSLQTVKSYLPRGLFSCRLRWCHQQPINTKHCSSWCVCVCVCERGETKAAALGGWGGGFTTGKSAAAPLLSRSAIEHEDAQQHQSQTHRLPLEQTSFWWLRKMETYCAYHQAYVTHEFIDMLIDVLK